MSLVVSALGARPRVVTGWRRSRWGTGWATWPEAVAQQAWKQCHPLENLIVDPDWRRAMVPVYVRRADGPRRRQRSEQVSEAPARGTGSPHPRPLPQKGGGVRSARRNVQR
jgi:hypothetical protein